MSKHSSMLRDPRWQKKRLEIMQRDNFQCVACLRKNKTLHVHHKKYIGKPWEAKDNDLQTLCEYCHKALGPHPKGGIWWEPIDDESGHSVGFSWSNCPICGSTDLREKGHYDACNQCGHRIIPNTKSGFFENEVE